MIRLSGMRAQEFLDRLDKRIDGLASLAFGVWYALGAQGVVPYVF